MFNLELTNFANILGPIAPFTTISNTLYNSCTNLLLKNFIMVKVKNCIKFLEQGNRVKVSIRFRGRQMAHTAGGLEVMNEFLSLLNNVIVEKPAKMEGRNMFMVLAPKN